MDWHPPGRLKILENQQNDNASQTGPMVVVLLSTCNGARYLDEQIGSILAQTWPHLRLIVRDDSSDDGTWPILLRWRQDARVVAFRGRAIGATTSYLQMLGMVDSTDEFVAFADQDGIWHPGKIACAVAALKPHDRRPALYWSRGLVLDETRIVGSATPAWPRPFEFGNVLVENVVIGASLVLNGPAAALVKSAGAPKEAIAHDWWCALVVAAFGSVIYDARPSILIREARGRRLTNLSLLVDQARAFRQHFGACLGPASLERALLDTVIDGSTLARRRLAWNRRLYRQFPRDDLLFRLRLLAGRWPKPRPVCRPAQVSVRVPS